ncbi:MAG: nucleoside deaminase [Planctomycetota bacterium]
MIRAMDDAGFLREAIALAVASVGEGGGPFGAVIVREGRVVARAANRVVPAADPTAHAEILAIRAAARVLGTHDLSGCTLYASAEPCPMCHGAIHWARLARVVHAADHAAAAAAGFDDALLLGELRLPAAARARRFERLLAAEGAAPFAAWAAKADRVPY